ncbi:hypothetical protein [Pseudoalteromonas rubra]|uniref:hypothetical protein n=1 Tax=Pseudoalteromonas rubra TaxID=43658 RepID=UPI000F776C72|nr:hypothetical protein [Pseudoalteromonas rubra]
MKSTFFRSGLALIAMLSSLSAHASMPMEHEFRGYFFESQNVQIKVDLQRRNKYSPVERIVFSAECGRNPARCTSDSFQARMMDDFVAALKHRKFYKYVFRAFDPCEQPGSGCTPMGVEPSEEASEVGNVDIQRRGSGYRPEPQPTHPGFFQTFWTSIAQAAGTTAVSGAADYLKQQSAEKNGKNKSYFIPTYRKGSQKIPSLVCKIEPDGCDTQTDITIRDLNNGKLAVSVPVGDGSSHGDNKEYWDREQSVREWLGDIEYKCIPAYTNTGSGLVLQMVCSYMK